MVIKNEKEKVITLLNDRDILDYVNEKCGCDINLYIENIIDENHELQGVNNEYNELELENDNLKDDNCELQDKNDILNVRIRDLEKYITDLNKEII